MDHRTLARLAPWSLALALFAPRPASAGGEKIDGYPSWAERVHLELTNRARVDPQLEMDACGANCTEGACYTPKPPLYLNRKNSRAARFHAANMKSMGFFAHTSKCTLSPELADTWESGCDGAVGCSCVGGQATCSPICSDPQQRVGIFGGSYSGEIIASGGSPSSAFYLWLHEPGDGDACKFNTKNGHRWLLLTANSGVGFGVSGYHVGDFGGADMSEVGKIASGVHWPRSGTSVEAWANWYDMAAPKQALVDVDGACQPMSLERGAPENGAYMAQIDGVGQGCHRYYFVFEDAQGDKITYPSEGSLGIGPEETCEDWTAERPPLGDGCDCAPSCGGNECGDDGCGGSCGACQAGETCEGGTCVCVPACAGKACGDDGCGGACGACGLDEVCQDGACAPMEDTGGSCAPICEGKACGDDGCGGECGTCPPGLACADGACVDGGATTGGSTSGGSDGGSASASASGSSSSASGGADTDAAGASDGAATSGPALPDGYGDADADEGCSCRQGGGGGAGAALGALLALALGGGRRRPVRVSSGTGRSAVGLVVPLVITLVGAGLGGCAGDDVGPSSGADTAALTTGTTTASTGGATTATATGSSGAASTGASASTTDASTSAGDPTTDATAAPTTEGTTGEGMTSTGEGTTGEGTTGAPACVVVDLGGPFTATVDEPGFAFELPMEPDTPYRRLTVTLQVTPKDWGGQCYNPYYNPPKLVPVFHQFLHIQRGAHWCKGGNLGGIDLQGPGSNRMIGEVYYRETPWAGSGCGPAIEPHAIFGGEKTLVIPEGETRAVTYLHDAEAGVIELTVGDAVFLGTPQPETDLRALAGHPLYLVLSRDQWLECFDAQGNEDPDAVCCHGPSIGWVYDAVKVELCE